MLPLHFLQFYLQCVLIFEYLPLQILTLTPPVNRQTNVPCTHALCTLDNPFLFGMFYNFCCLICSNAVCEINFLVFRVVFN